MNPFEVIQPFFAERLKSLNYFSDVAVGAPRLFREGDSIQTPKTISDMIDKTLVGLTPVAGKVGAAVRVFQAGFNVPKPNLPGPQGNLFLPIRCEVNPLVNFGATGTQKFVSAIASEVLRAGHSFRIEGVCGSLFANGDCFDPYFSEETKMMTVDVILQAMLPLVPLDSVIKPTFALGGGMVTLTNNTPGATIYYTKNLGYPSQAAGATQYAAPFAVVSGEEIFYAAYKAGLAGSSVGYEKIP